MTQSESITRFLENPQGLLDYIEQTGDFDAGFDYIEVIYEVAQTLDRRLDIVLPGMEELWEKMPPRDYKGMNFYEATVRRTRLKPETIKRHTKVGKMYEAVPEELRPAIEGMNFKGKIQIAHALEDGYDLNKPVLDSKTGEQKSESGWKFVADGYYPQEVSVRLHEIKGTQPRSQFCKFEVDEDGSIIANTAKGRVTAYRRVEYDNPEIAELMEWVFGKAENKLGVTPKMRY